MPSKQNPGGNRGEKLTGQVREQEKDGPGTFHRQPLRERLESHTLPYLSALLGCSEDDAWGRTVTFQTFDDTPTKNPKRARINHGCLDDLGEDARRQLPLCIGDNYTRASGVAPNR